MSAIQNRITMHVVRLGELPVQPGEVTPSRRRKASGRSPGWSQSIGRAHEPEASLKSGPKFPVPSGRGCCINCTARSPKVNIAPTAESSFPAGVFHAACSLSRNRGVGGVEVFCLSPIAFWRYWCHREYIRERDGVTLVFESSSDWYQFVAMVDLSELVIVREVVRADRVARVTHRGRGRALALLLDRGDRLLGVGEAFDCEDVHRGIGQAELSSTSMNVSSASQLRPAS
jgi:hypothetical protein